jgi:hypothetical protein
MSAGGKRTPGLPSPCIAHVPLCSWITTRVQVLLSSVRRAFTVRRTCSPGTRSVTSITVGLPGSGSTGYRTSFASVHQLLFVASPCRLGRHPASGAVIRKPGHDG